MRNVERSCDDEPIDFVDYVDYLTNEKSFKSFMEDDLKRPIIHTDIIDEN